MNQSPDTAASATGPLHGPFAQTFLFADLAGYTALTEAHCDAYAADTAGRLCDLVRALLAEYGAEELNLIGDALLIRVRTAPAAAELAERIVCDHGHHHGLAARVGMHSGTAVHRGDDWFGSAINLAARVADIAAAGEVLLTDTTRQALGEAARTRPRGRRAFKNVARPVELHELVLRSDRPQSKLSIDPVCRMAVDPALAAGSQTHRGVVHHFCSERCHDLFDRTPARYARAPEAPDGPRERYVTAAGRPALTGVYDLAVALTVRERRWRPRLLGAVMRDLPPGGTLLELGCGTGTNAIAIAQRRPDATVVAIDGDPSALAIARTKTGAERVTWRHALATAPLPVASTVDVALCSLLLHHLTDPDKQRVLECIADALPIDGTLHIADWGPPRGPATRFGSRGLRLLDGRDGPESLLAGGLPAFLTYAGFPDHRRSTSVPTVWGMLELWHATASPHRDRRRGDAR